MRLLAPVALALLVMLPRLCSPQFGLLDDGFTLKTGHEIQGRWSSVLYLIPETGRFFPAYWLVYSAIVSVVGVWPLAFFTVNVLLLAGLTAILARLVRLAGGTRPQAAAAAVLFSLGGPAVEAFYTLSKAEPLQLTWIGLSLLVTVAAARDARPAIRAVLMALATLTVLLAHATKETSLVLVPISLGWLAIEWRDSPDRRDGLRFAAAYVVINVIAASAFVALRWFYAPLGLAEGWYTRAYALEPPIVRTALFRICAWLLRDFAFLVPLGAAAVVARPSQAARPVRFAAVWVAGWLAVFLPWPATFEYYLLPFAFGAAIVGGMAIGDVWARTARGHSPATRRLAWSVLVTSAALWLLTLVNAAEDARVQLTVDRANTDLVDFLGGLPEGSRVVLNNDRVNEYLSELRLHLAQIKRRRDIVVQPVTGTTLAGPSPAPVFLVTPNVANQPSPTVRVALDETGARRDNALLRAVLTPDAALVYRADRHADLVEIAIHRVLCPLARRPPKDLVFCPDDRAIVERRRFSYGWQVHRLGRPVAGRVEADRHG